MGYLSIDYITVLGKRRKFRQVCGTNFWRQINSAKVINIVKWDLNVKICRLCKKNTVDSAIDFGRQPIVHNLSKAPNKGYENYSFELGNCCTCGFLQLLHPIPPEVLYENYITFSSWKKQPHVPRLINVIQSLFGDDVNHRVLDVGCNDGSFLETLKGYGYKKLFGIEPTIDSSSIAKKKGFNVKQCFFSQETANQLYRKDYFDIVITRHVLEHILNLESFLKGIHDILDPKGILVIEVPDSDWNLRYLDYALWEEHVNYFTLVTLTLLLKNFSFEIVHYEATLFSGRALTVFCKKSNIVSKRILGLGTEETKIQRYITKWPDFKRLLSKFLESLGKPIAMYGCGCRSANFLNLTGTSKYVDFFIDDQKKKQNLFVPGQKELEVKPWMHEEFEDYIFLLGVNTENESKVIKRRKMVYSAFFSVLPPSFNLPDFWNKLIYD